MSAPKTEWTPLVPGGETLSTHKLVESSNGLVMRKSWGTWYLGGIGLFIGAPLVVVGVFASLPTPSCSSAFTVCFGLFFSWGGLRYLLPRAIRFDAQQREVSIEGRRVPFADIAALQLLEERVEGEDVSFSSFELNVVLRDGSRLNVVDHAKDGQIRAEATKLAALLDCPVLDGHQVVARRPRQR